MSQTVWDIPPDMPTPAHGEVDGKIDEPSRGGGGIDLGVFAALAVNLGSLVDRIDTDRIERRDRLEASIPGDWQNANGGTFPTSGNLSLYLGSPDQGQFWNLRRIVVGGSDITTTPAGSAWLFIQGANPIQNGANPSIAQASDHAATLPLFAFYGSHEQVVDETEGVWVIIVGGTSGTQYVASIKAEVYERSLMHRYGG